MTVKNQDQPVPSGLEVTGVIEYVAKSNQEQHDIIVVDIDGQEMKISLLAFPARPEISVDGIELYFHSLFKYSVLLRDRMEI